MGKTVWGRNVVIKNFTYFSKIHEGHPARHLGGVAADGTVVTGVHFAKEVNEKGRVLSWWVRLGMIGGTAYGGGTRYKTKAAALLAYNEAVNRALEIEKTTMAEAA